MTIKEDFKRLVEEKEHFRMLYEKTLLAYIELRKKYNKLIKDLK